MRARVVNDVRCPEEPNAMGDVVRPVAAEIEKYVAGDECPPVEGHSPGQQVVNPDKHQE